MRRWIIDTDPGIDDALALLLAFHSPEVRVEALTIVSGNVGAELGARNALLTMEAAGLPDPPPVARGAVKPLARDLVDAAHVHGEDGLGGAAAELGPPRGSIAKTPALDLMLETISDNPHEIAIVALGPLTNIAEALLADPATMALVQEIVIMGGSLQLPGNATPTAEFNFYADPEAARIVLGSGAPITLIGLDVTTQARIARPTLVRRAKTSARRAASFAERISRRYFDFRETLTGRSECFLHDPLAVGAALDPTFVQTRRLRVDVETEGRLTAGMLVADLREGAPQPSDKKCIEVAVEVDADRFAGFFLDRLFG